MKPDGSRTMHVTLTVKLQAESKEELIQTFGSSVQHYRKHVEELRKGSVFGPADSVDVRFLVVGSEWRESEPDIAVQHAQRPVLEE